MKVARPESEAEVAELVRSGSGLGIVGGGTKPALIADAPVRLETGALEGIVEYDPAEYTITARAGTTLRELEEALEEKGQHLPFDPPWVKAGATLGGTVAAGVSGPGRFRYGGVRDFLIGVRFVDGRGRAIRGGGKVVKNAAGFDFPKLMVGSHGRFGVLTEVSLKVFPRPASTRSVRIACADAATAVDRIARAANSRWCPDALDYLPGESALALRLGGPEAALDALVEDIAQQWPGEVEPLEEAWWEAAREMTWCGENGIVKAPVTPSRIAPLEAALSAGGPARRYSSGGAVAWLAPRDDESGRVDEILRDLGLRGLRIRGAGSLCPGEPREGHIFDAVRKTLDPEGVFGGAASL